MEKRLEDILRDILTNMTEETKTTEETKDYDYNTVRLVVSRKGEIKLDETIELKNGDYLFSFSDRGLEIAEKVVKK